MTSKRTPADKTLQDCLKILRSENPEQSNKWLADQKLTSYKLRIEKASEVINVFNFMLNKMDEGKASDLMSLLVEYYRSNQSKSVEYAHLLKHFSVWDSQFEFIYSVAVSHHKNSIKLYLRTREAVIGSIYNKGRRELMSGVIADQQDWANIARFVFKNSPEENVVDVYTQVVKEHFMQVKKSQSERLNGAEFLKVCQLMEGKIYPQQKNDSPLRRSQSNSSKMMKVFDQTFMNDLRTEDRELIRVLSYKDKNIAKMLEEKHTKMVHIIGEEVNQLRKDIHTEKQKYIKVVDEKQDVVRMAQKMKEASLRYIAEKSEQNQMDLLGALELYNQRYNPKASDVSRAAQIVKKRRLIEIIEKEEQQQV